MTSKYSALSINTSLIFRIRSINGALFLKEIPLIRFLVSLLFASITAAVLAAALAAFVCSVVLPSGKILSGKRSSVKSLLT